MPTPRKRKRVARHATVAVLVIPDKPKERAMRNGGQILRNEKTIRALPPGTYRLVIQ